jgi:hypothetical protein
MKTIRFTRNTIPEREGGPGYREGDIKTLRDDRAARWLRRGAAVAAEPLKRPVVEKVPPPAPPQEPAPIPAPASGGHLRTHPGQDIAGGVMIDAEERNAARRAEDAAATSKSAPTHNELLALAEATGVKVDGRWSDERLKEEIEKAAEATATSKAKK